jgi:glycerate-2-kinase
MKSDVLKLFRTAIAAVDPYACVKHHLVFNNNHTNDEKKELHIGDANITLNHNLYVAAFGKAALGRREYRRRILIAIILFLIRHVPSCG